MLCIIQRGRNALESGRQTCLYLGKTRWLSNWTSGKCSRLVIGSEMESQPPGQRYVAQWRNEYSGPFIPRLSFAFSLKKPWVHWVHLRKCVEQMKFIGERRRINGVHQSVGLVGWIADMFAFEYMTTVSFLTIAYGFLKHCEPDDKVWSPVMCIMLSTF